MPTESLTQGDGLSLRYSVAVDEVTRALLSAVAVETSPPQLGCSRELCQYGDDTVSACPYCGLMNTEIITASGELLQLEKVIAAQAVGPIEPPMVVGRFLSDEGSTIYQAGMSKQFGRFRPTISTPGAERLQILAGNALCGVTQSRIANLLSQVRREHGQRLLSGFDITVVAMTICSANRYLPAADGRCVYPPRQALGFRLLSFNRKDQINQIFLVDASGIIALERD